MIRSFIKSGIPYNISAAATHETTKSDTSDSSDVLNKNQLNLRNARHYYIEKKGR